MPAASLGFRLGGKAPTRIADAPHFIKGMPKPRGSIVPIVNLRLKRGCEAADPGGITVGIVRSVRGQVFDALLDPVPDGLARGAGRIKPAPKMSPSVDAALA